MNHLDLLVSRLEQVQEIDLLGPVGLDLGIGRLRLFECLARLDDDAGPQEIALDAENAVGVKLHGILRNSGGEGGSPSPSPPPWTIQNGCSAKLSPFASDDPIGLSSMVSRPDFLCCMMFSAVSAASRRRDMSRIGRAN